MKIFVSKPLFIMFIFSLLTILSCHSEVLKKTKKSVILSMDLAMGLTTGNANGSSPSPSDYDDAWALALAANSPTLNILGVVVTMGNNALAPEMLLAPQTLNSLNLDVPLIPGASNWLPEMSQTSSNKTQCINDGVLFISNQLKINEQVTILATGPLTDIACLILNFPQDASKIHEIIALLGSEPGPLLFHGKQLHDFNYAMDPQALKIVLDDSSIPFTAIMFGASSSTEIPTSIVYELSKSTIVRAQYFGQSSTAYARWWEEKVSSEKPIWDASVIWYALHPQDFLCKFSGYRLSLGQPLNTFNDSVYDWFSTEFTETRQVNTCNSYRSKNAIDMMNFSTIASILLH